jgi:anti-sigma regulatory factor (Ser/Thr protein kinase)
VTQLLLYSGACSIHLPRLVRHRLTTQRFAGLVPDYLRGDLQLVATELVSNAYNAGARNVDVSLFARLGALTIEVSDDAPGVPAQGPPDITSDHGRGLGIIGAVSTQWGYRIVDPDCKTVWAHFALRST